MSEDVIQLIGLAILALSEYYAIRGDGTSIFAPFWDFVAKLTGAIANFFASISVKARLAYFEAVQI